MALFLLLANLGFFAFQHLRTLGSHDSDRLAQQIHPEGLKPFTLAQVKAMALDRPASPPKTACLEWGPFSEDQRSKAESALAALAPGHGITTKSVEVTTAYWVYVPPLASKPVAEKKMAEFRELGVTEMYLMQENNPQKFAISLGLFRNEDSARAHLDHLHQLGIKSAKLAPRTQTLSQVLLVLREPPQELLARLEDLRAQFPSSEAKQLACSGKPNA